MPITKEDIDIYPARRDQRRDHGYNRYIKRKERKHKEPEPTPMFSLEIHTNPRELYNKKPHEEYYIFVGKTLIASENSEHDQEWELRLTMAKMLVSHAGGVIIDKR